MAIILEGKSIKETIRQELKDKIRRFSKIPILTIIQVGENAASETFIKLKKSFGKSIGVEVIHKKSKSTIGQIDLLKEIQILNKDVSIHGIIVQLPLPNHLNKFEIIESLDPKKDVDRLHSKNKAEGLHPATTRGILTLLSHYKIEVPGRNILMIGRSELVGVPTALALIKNDATVTIAHSQTKNLENLIKQADIVICAVGKANFIKKEMINSKQIIIDVGINNLNGMIVGDVDFPEVSQVVKAITPVPGGIGPLTVASIFQNLLDSFEQLYN